MLLASYLIYGLNMLLVQKSAMATQNNQSALWMLLPLIENYDDVSIKSIIILQYETGTFFPNSPNYCEPGDLGNIWVQYVSIGQDKEYMPRLLKLLSIHKHSLIFLCNGDNINTFHNILSNIEPVSYTHLTLPTNREV